MTAVPEPSPANASDTECWSTQHKAEDAVIRISDPKHENDNPESRVRELESCVRRMVEIPRLMLVAEQIHDSLAYRGACGYAAKQLEELANEYNVEVELWPATNVERI